MYKVPDVPTSHVSTIRPYLPADKKIIYRICTRTCKDGLEDPLPYPDNLKDLQADKIVGPYLTLHPEFCFVVEDDSAVVGYVCAAPDYQKFRDKMEIAWIPKLCQKYPLNCANDLHTFAEVIALLFVSCFINSLIYPWSTLPEPIPF